MGGGGLEGASRLSRETAMWDPPPYSMDAMMSMGRAKEMADLRSRDSVQNDGYAHGAMAIHRDSIVGSHYRLNARPDYRTLRAMGFTADDTWAEEFQTVVENRFDLIGDSPSCWLDAAGTKTFTDMVRMVVGTWVLSGEDLATAEWLKGPNRPIRTAINLIAPSRLSNPDGMWDTRYLRQGIERDKFGRPLAYHIRVADPGDRIFGTAEDLRWMRIPREKPWGRRQVIHNFSGLQPGQSRGISDMVSVLKSMRMTRKYQEMVLQNAVIQASYAATIESEIPRDMIMQMMGEQVTPDVSEVAKNYLGELLTYVGSGRNLKIDGSKVPVLYPGTKLNVSPLGGPGGVGEGFEQSLLRHIASGLGLSYEQFSRDYSNTNYSSARASLSETEKYMASRKKQAADAFATQVWLLVLEEEVSRGNVPLPGGMRRQDFYRAPLVKEALGRCRWIGAGQGTIDRLKEVQAALMAIKGGLSTYETEIAKMGGDFRDVFEQRQREEKIIADRGLSFETTTPGQLTNQAQADGGNQTEEEQESGNA